MAVLSLTIFIGCSSSKTFDMENNPNEGTDVFSVNTPDNNTTHDSESKVDSSSPPPDSAYNPPSAETTETSDATSDSSDSVDAGDSNVDVNALDDSDDDTTDSTDTTDTDSADGDSGMIVVPPSPDTFVGIDTPVVNTETSPDTTDTVDNIETTESDDSDDNSDTPASIDSADGEETEIAVVPVCLCDDDDACTVDTCVDNECIHVLTYWCVECVDDADCAGVGWCPGPANTSILLATGKCGVDGTCEAVGKQCPDGEICAMTDNIDGPYAWGAKCIPTPECYVDAECDDGDVCNGAETCDMNKCVAGQKLVCSDFNVCTDDFCDSVEGCVYEQNTNPCDDGDICTTNSCDATTGCIYKPISGCCKTDIDCNDINQCTGDACIKSSGECVHFGLLGNCDDGNACTTNDTCQVGKCIGGSTLDCNDGNACTADSCDSTTGCANVKIPCCEDVDCDEIKDEVDNCPNVFNPGQGDKDKDGVGDACDTINTCKVKKGGFPPTFEEKHNCIDGCFVGDTIVCIVCVSPPPAVACTGDYDQDGAMSCEGDCNIWDQFKTFQCWPDEKKPTACSGSSWTPTY